MEIRAPLVSILLPGLLIPSCFFLFSFAAGRKAAKIGIVKIMDENSYGENVNNNNICFLTCALLFVYLCLAGCGRRSQDPGIVPEEVLHPESGGLSESGQDYQSGQLADTGRKAAGDSKKNLENAVTVKIGLIDQTDYDIDMVENGAVGTMLGYLSGSELCFPAYTYDEAEGEVAENIRGTYIRDEGAETQDIRAGDLYLFSGGQLRLYFKDMEGENITAAPVGHFEDAEGGKDCGAKGGKNCDAKGARGNQSRCLGCGCLFPDQEELSKGV